MVVAVHVGLAATRFRGDELLLPLAIALAAVGLVTINRVAAAEFALRQTIWMLLGLGLLAGTLFVVRDPPALRRYKYTWAIAGIILLGITLVFGRDINGSGQRLWLDFRLFQIQPTELVKVFLVFFLAAYLEEHREMLSFGGARIGRLSLPPLPYLLPLGIMWGICLLILFFQKDLGPALLFFGVFIIMLYVASSRAIFVLVGGAAFLLAALIGYRFLDTVQNRVDAWLDPWSRASTTGYQLIQALIAMGSGGVLGSGLTYGLPDRIPAVHTDFVLAAIGEEMGLLGSLAVLAIYVLLVYRGFRIALEARNPFNQLLAAGLSTVVGLQTLVIMGGVLGVMPLTGVTMPFISYGGSSLLTNFLIIGILLRISADSRTPAGPPL
jgi:cell division protein FtsW (lipid II flippase)